ncbi:MAG: hypothetical protein DMF82_01025 [Acidobacteria bacterium]|nr:MAG: hypothetical protein DMF82_01025 [Acidobacteriota bacterium]
MKRQIALMLLIGLTGAGVGVVLAASDAAPLRLVQTIALPGVEGRIDHLAVDVAGQRLFVAALGNNTLEVIDIAKGQRARSVRGFTEPQGVAYLPETNMVAVANGGSGVVTFLDGASFEPVKTVAFGEDADNLRYDAARKCLYVGYGGGALGAYDAARGARLADVALEAHPESFQLDSASGRIFVNVASLQKVAVVDTRRNTVAATWPVVAGAANFPMALDASHRRLFVLTRKPPHLVVLDTETGKAVATLPAAADADDLFYDAARQRLYGVFGAGSVIVFGQRDADHYEALATVSTVAGARTGLFSPELKRLFVAVPHRANPSAEIRVFDTGASPAADGGAMKAPLAKERGIAARAVSRGTNPDPSVPAPVVDALRGDGSDVAAFKPQRLERADVAAADRVVAIGVDLGEVGAAARAGALVQWDDIPSFSASYPKAREAMLWHVGSLLEDVGRRRPE